MAIIHQATIRPTKAELLERVLEGPVTVLGAYRFDDPDGEVGVEGFVVGTGTATRHVVLGYRGTPLEGAEEHLVATMEHSVLGRRWIYSGAADPVVVACFRRALAGAQQQAEEELWDGDVRLGSREPTARLSVEGPTDAGTDGRLVLVDHLDGADGLGGPAGALHGPLLRVSWDGGTAVAAYLG